MWQVFAAAGQKALGVINGTQQTKTNWKAVKKANLETWANAAQAVSTVNINRGLLRQQTAQTLFDQGKATSSALGLLATGTASSGTVGASVNAAALDVSRQQSQAGAQTEADFQLSNIDLNTTIVDIMKAAGNAMQYATKPMSTSTMIGSALFNPAAFENYAGTQGAQSGQAFDSILSDMLSKIGSRRSTPSTSSGISPVGTRGFSF